jgi:hypothetical protein
MAGEGWLKIRKKYKKNFIFIFHKIALGGGVW